MQLKNHPRCQKLQSPKRCKSCHKEMHLQTITLERDVLHLKIAVLTHASNIVFGVFYLPGQLLKYGA